MNEVDDETHWVPEVDTGSAFPTFGTGKSVLHMSISEAQSFIEEYAGSGMWKSNNKEIIDAGRVIGTWVRSDGGERRETTHGIIHYSKTGCHIVPARPERIE